MKCFTVTRRYLNEAISGGDYRKALLPEEGLTNPRRAGQQSLVCWW